MEKIAKGTLTKMAISRKILDRFGWNQLQSMVFNPSFLFLIYLWLSRPCSTPKIRISTNFLEKHPRGSTLWPWRGLTPTIGVKSGRKCLRWARYDVPSPKWYHTWYLKFFLFFAPQSGVAPPLRSCCGVSLRNCDGSIFVVVLDTLRTTLVKKNLGRELVLGLELIFPY